MKTIILSMLFVLSAAAARAENPAPSAPPIGGNGLPTEVVIKAQEGSSKLNTAKPPLRIDVDPYESIRPALKPDESLLLSVSPLTIMWRRTHPEFLYSERVIQPWRTTFSQRSGIVFRMRDQLNEAMQRKLDPKESKSYMWTLTVADEEGRLFYHKDGSDAPPEELVWSGQNEQGEWVRAGRSYSAVYTFTDPGGSQRTIVGKPLLFRGIVHQEESGLYISLDASVLFGTTKSNTKLADAAAFDLARSAADLIKRRFYGIPISIRVFAQTPELGAAQGAILQALMGKELMLASRNVTVQATRASYSDQRVEIVVLNR